MKGNRGERLSSQFQREIYGVISSDIKNRYPEMSAIISVTDVDVAPDLKTAKVYVSIFDKDEARKNTTFKILSDSAAYIRHSLSKTLHLRTVPQLNFLIDDSMAYGDRIDKILKGIEDDDAKRGD